MIDNETLHFTIKKCPGYLFLIFQTKKLQDALNERKEAIYNKNHQMILQESTKVYNNLKKSTRIYKSPTNLYLVYNKYNTIILQVSILPNMFLTTFYKYLTSIRQVSNKILTSLAWLNKSRLWLLPF